ncbi:MAG: DUF3108 domain-containing protein [Methylotenera sp.]|nr:DUF3108 domain-containing protein [Methylotenera sp.]MDP1754578.1 DUF3108 domain-containing protein [Methylotenera sp.]MDP1958573.1 DUF3108 domain-containing protein [Methylotenera sp.]MDP3207007.1 DUF3108 domain-containing protein [Methylotenera sp.]MDP3303720.1 DUF3108 domain-containing protein [Methylotenera sp.]
MFNHIKGLSVVFFLFAGSIAFAQPAITSKTALPKQIQATYAVTKNGQPFANVHEQFSITDNTYKVESITKGIGVYALFGERQLISVGDVTTQGLKPSRFELHQGDNAKKSLLADFDWVKQNLTMTVKGKVKEASLALGSQDLASYAYQFMFLPTPLKDTITVVLTTGKKLNHYHYKINPVLEVIENAGVQYKTLHLEQSDQNSAETKELWLATEHYYVPVRIMMIDENGQKLEQTLTELHIE